MMAMWRSLAEISGSTRPHVLSAQAYGMSVGRMMIAARRAISDTERRFPVRIRVGTPPWGLGDRLDQIQTWLDALRGRWLGDGASRFARPAERRDRDLLQRRYPGCRLCCPVVRRLSGREHRRRLPETRGSADAAHIGWLP